MKILLLSRIDPNAIASLEERAEVEYAFDARLEDLEGPLARAQVLVFRSGVDVSRSLLERAPNLRLIVRAGSGLDNISVDDVRSTEIRLVRIPGPSAQAVAELTFALMLGIARKVPLADRLLRAGHWPKPQLGGSLLRGKSLGIIGAGNIVARVGELGAAWGMQPLGCVKNPSHECEAKLRSRSIRLASLDEVIATADFLTLHVPLAEDTFHLIDSVKLAKMKPGSYLINTSRGGVVDEEALYKELTKGTRILGAGLDVHEEEGEGTISPLSDLPNVVLTPHIGAMALDSQHEIGTRLLELVTAFQQGLIDSVASRAELVV